MIEIPHKVVTDEDIFRKAFIQYSNDLLRSQNSEDLEIEIKNFNFKFIPQTELIQFTIHYECDDQKIEKCQKTMESMKTVVSFEVSKLCF